MPRPTLKKCLLAAMMFSSLSLMGCQSARIENPLIAPGVVNADEEQQLAFWHELAQRPLVANDEAFHALLLFVDGKDENTDYAGRVEALKSRRMLPGSFNAPADQAITRGDLAVALAGALDIKGGVMMRLTGGTSARYATRELIYQGVYPQGVEYQTFTGTQFVGIIAQAEDYQREHGRKETPASPLE